MAANGDRSASDAIEDDGEKYNYYHCKYTHSHIHTLAQTIELAFRLCRKYKSENT